MPDDVLDFIEQLGRKEVVEERKPKTGEAPAKRRHEDKLAKLIELHEELIDKLSGLLPLEKEFTDEERTDTEDGLLAFLTRITPAIHRGKKPIMLRLLERIAGNVNYTKRYTSGGMAHDLEKSIAHTEGMLHKLATVGLIEIYEDKGALRVSRLTELGSRYVKFLRLIYDGSVSVSYLSPLLYLHERGVCEYRKFVEETKMPKSSLDAVKNRLGLIETREKVGHMPLLSLSERGKALTGEICRVFPELRPEM